MTEAMAAEMAMPPIIIPTIHLTIRVSIAARSSFVA